MRARPGNAVRLLIRPLRRPLTPSGGARYSATVELRAANRFWRSRGAVLGAPLVLLVVLAAGAGPFLAPFDPDRQFDDALEEDGTPVEPNDVYLLGADTIGRDELSRLLHGGAISLTVALTATAIAVLLGVLLGVLAGWRGGWLDRVLMQLADVSNSLPFLLVAIAVNRVVARPEMWTLAILLGVLSWTALARVTRTKTMQVRELDYVVAARALGMRDRTLLRKHVLPNVLGPALVLGTTIVAQMVLIESAMSFLGVGVQPPTSTWGSMLRDAQEVMWLAPRLVAYPGVFILLTVFGFNLLGEGLRDAFDPKDGPSDEAGPLRNVVAFASLGAAIAIGVVLLPPMPDRPVAEGAGTPEDEPHHGGTFVFHHESDIRGLDPHVNYDEISGMAMKLLFEGLIDYDYDANFVPRLAEALPEISEDGLEYTFRLRDDVRFSNGRALVAEDVRWSMEHMLHPDTGSPGAGSYELILGAPAFHAGEADHVSGIEVLDERTIRFRLSRADQTFLNAMAMIFAYPVPRENYEAHPDDVSEHPVGTGAFLLESWEPGVRLTFVRNPEYFIEGRPYVDRMIYELNLVRHPALLRFLSGDLDHIHRTTPTDYLWLMRQERWAPYVVNGPLLDVWGLQMNCELPPFDDVHVRRAVAFAIDRPRWRRARANRMFLTGQPIPSGIAGYDETLEGAHVFDLDRAREEMALAGHPVRADGDGFVAEGMPEIELWTGEGDTGRMYGELTQADLARIGITVRLRQVAFPIFLQETGRRRTVSMLFQGWSADFPDASNFLDTLFRTDSIHETGSENRSFYGTPELDALLDRARVERDRTARIAMYREASGMIVRDAPWAFIFSSVQTEAWQPYVRGYRPHPVWSQLYRDVWLDEPRRRVADVLRGAGAGSFAALAPFGDGR